MPFYIDSSALVKFVIEEPESSGLRQWSTSAGPNVVTSNLGKTELLRMVQRLVPGHLERAGAVLQITPQLKLTSNMFDFAGHLEPANLRTLDALHLACAMSFEDELNGIVTYDHRLAEAAGLAGIPVVSPT